MFKVSQRIKLIADLLESKDLLVDTCSDHGLIGEYCYFRNKAKNVIFNDINLNICKKLELKFKNNPHFEVICRDAKDVLLPDSISKNIIIAGVGGILGIEILNGIKDQIGDGDSVLLSLHNNRKKIFEYLSQENFNIKNHQVIKENSQFYEVIVLNKSNVASIDPLGISDINLPEDYTDYLINYYNLKAKYSDQYAINFIENIKKSQK